MDQRDFQFTTGPLFTNVCSVKEALGVSHRTIQEKDKIIIDEWKRQNHSFP